jgi:lipoprotein signal peptidase
MKTYEQFVNENFDHKLITDMFSVAYYKAIKHLIRLHEKITEEHIHDFINLYIYHNYGESFPHSKEAIKYIKHLIHRKLLKSKLIKK